MLNIRNVGDNISMESWAMARATLTDFELRRTELKQMARRLGHDDLAYYL
jgi:hypothetical protein